MTAVVDVLQEFFSPSSQEKVWSMPESDVYTQIVRDWLPVQSAEVMIMMDLMDAKTKWVKTNPMWKPTIENSRRAQNFGKYGHWHKVPSPQGTSAETCESELKKYLSGRVLSKITNSIVEQRIELYRAVIGTFTIYTTLDKFNGKDKTATLNFWMFNAMTKKSIGEYALNNKLSHFGMMPQYMWWNWVAEYDWKIGVPRRITGWR